MKPADLVELRLEDAVRLGAEKVCISLALTMYFKAPLAEFPDEIGRVLEAYLDEHAEPNLRWYADWEDTKFRPPTPERLRLPAQLLRDPKFRTKKSLGWIFLGGKHFEDLTEWHVHGLNQIRYRDTNLSFLRLTFPIGYWSGREATFAAWVKRVVTLVPVFHGHAGFAFNQNQDLGAKQALSAYVYALAMRFHGIEVDDTAKTAESCFKSIKGVNWLTLVSEPLLDELGGVNMTTAALEKAGGITVDRMPWGLCIQAGDEPGIGDVNEDPKPLPLYRKVNKILRPIRTTTHFPLGDDEYQKSFGMAGTLRWLRRFDDEDPGP